MSVERRDPLVGAILDQRFSIVLLLAADGSGAVYCATDLLTNAEAALKVVHPRLADSMLVERFCREGATLASLRYPHPSTGYEPGQVPDAALYIVMPRAMSTGCEVGAATQAASDDEQPTVPVTRRRGPSAPANEPERIVPADRSGRNLPATPLERSGQVTMLGPAVPPPRLGSAVPVTGFKPVVLTSDATPIGAYLAESSRPVLDARGARYPACPSSAVMVPRSSAPEVGGRDVPVTSARGSQHTLDTRGTPPVRDGRGWRSKTERAAWHRQNRGKPGFALRVRDGARRVATRAMAAARTRDALTPHIIVWSIALFVIATVVTLLVAR